jgi:hypothetical protein
MPAAYDDFGPTTIPWPRAMPEGTAMLTRLIYASHCAQPLSPTMVDGLLAQARSNNQARGLTGLMLLDSHCFLQAIEGDRESVNALYAKLIGDPRHRQLLLLDYAPTDQRRFGQWTMGFASAHSAHAAWYLRYGRSTRFEPHALTGPAALGLLLAFAAAADVATAERSRAQTTTMPCPNG